MPVTLVTAAQLNIRNSEDLRRYCDMKVKAYNAEMHELAVMWPDLKRRLRRVPSHRGGPLGWSDPVLIANKVSGHVRNAETAAETAAKAMRQCWFDYETMILNPPKGSADWTV